MALNLFSRYPGRANPASIDYPQGSFKNKTAPTATDGTLLEQDWANDTQGFLQSILSYFGVTANGQVDKVGASQYFDALASDPTETHKGMPLVASQTETNVGENDSKFVTPKKLRAGFSYSNTGSSSFIAFPTWLGGLIIQFGYAGLTGTTHSFPIAFPNNLIGLVGSHDGGSYAGISFLRASTNNATFHALRDPSSGNAAAYRWIAIGW